MQKILEFSSSAHGTQLAGTVKSSATLLGGVLINVLQKTAYWHLTNQGSPQQGVTARPSYVVSGMPHGVRIAGNAI